VCQGSTLSQSIPESGGRCWLPLAPPWRQGLASLPCAPAARGRGTHRAAGCAERMAIPGDRLGHPSRRVGSQPRPGGMGRGVPPRRGPSVPVVVRVPAGACRGAQGRCGSRRRLPRQPGLGRKKTGSVSGRSSVPHPAQQGSGADCQKPTLRSGFRQRLTADVRCCTCSCNGRKVHDPMCSGSH
jgi:hypothetical protein